MQSMGGEVGTWADGVPKPPLPRGCHLQPSENRSLPFFTFESWFCTWIWLLGVASPGLALDLLLLPPKGMAALGTGSSIPSLVLVQIYHQVLTHVRWREMLWGKE